jgi:hypothetical protein
VQDDFDLAAPGSVAWELAVAACFWAFSELWSSWADRHARAHQRLRVHRADLISASH